ncbi:MAG: uracil-DNA glycosylase [Sulfurospirillum sp.]|nr:uracil-DNA glycosylase [Sulfurospirillum sp.]
MKVCVANSWQDIIAYAYDGLSLEYREFLEKNEGYFPDYTHFLNAFTSLSLQDTRYILFGQDPYPRIQSANGYAFIDGGVKTLFSQSGLSKEVNRATSLRNFLKMLLLGENMLTCNDLSQGAIAKVDKTGFINSTEALRKNFEKNGVLLLNSALVFTCKAQSRLHIKAFEPFMQRILEKLQGRNIKLILFGSQAAKIERSLPQIHKFTCIKTMHPYNLSFIQDTSVQEFFTPMHLLRQLD